MIGLLKTTSRRKVTSVHRPKSQSSMNRESFYLPDSCSVDQPNSINARTLEGDTWIEIIVILSRKDGTKRARKLYYSPRTQTGQWFEPPENAGKVVRRKDLMYMAKETEHERNNNDPSATSRHYPVDAFVPRRSTKRKFESVAIVGDGDTWIELILTLIRRNGDSTIRSLFYSINSQVGIWDEPPSGASIIVLYEQVKSSVLLDIPSMTSLIYSRERELLEWASYR